MPFDFTITDLEVLRGSVDPEKMTPTERLIYLRDFLRSGIPNILWDMREYRVDPSCGTAGCACGWYDYLIGTVVPTWSKAFDTDLNPFGLTKEEFNRCFTPFRFNDIHGTIDPPHKVTNESSPIDVANEITNILEERDNRKGNTTK